MESVPINSTALNNLRRQVIILDENVIQSLDHLARLLLEENRKTNLTAIRTYEEVISRHFLDSLKPFEWGWKAPEGPGCDIGTGAGFPGLIHALIEPSRTWSLVETVGKKLDWLALAGRELGLQNLLLLRVRAELLGRDLEHREQYGLCLARAVAPGPVMLEYALPLLRVGGELWTWQGDGFTSVQWENALRLMGGEISEISAYTLPNEDPGEAENWFGLEKPTPRPRPIRAKSAFPPNAPFDCNPPFLFV
jgi:16S rRNA (guanine527-N7)-methyltransferase